MVANHHSPARTVCDTLSEITEPTVRPKMKDATGRLNRNACEILLNVLAQIEVFPELDVNLAAGLNPYPAAMRTIGVPYRPDTWFDKPLDNVRRQAYSRATKWLERAGLVHRITEPYRNRVTHLVLTFAGLQQAIEIAGPQADRLAITEGLRMTNWGKDLAMAMHAKHHRCV